MGTFWLKTAIFAAVVMIGGIVVVNWLSGGVKQATDFESVEKKMAEQDEALDEELDAAGSAQQQIRQPVRPEQQAPAARIPRNGDLQMTEADRVSAERLYQMAYTEYKMGRLPGMTFKKMVDHCRDLFEHYPDSPQSAKARILMRKLPDRFKDLYGVTSEEMGL